jgi:hypothetical protein
MFSSGWAIFLGLAATVAKKHIPSSQCVLVTMNQSHSRFHSENACMEHGTPGWARSSYCASMEKDVL